jgi:hypothetical protein
MPVFSARSPALDGVSWVRGGLVEVAVGHGLFACNRIGAVVCSLLDVAPCGSSIRSPVWWIGSLSRSELGFVPQHRVDDDGEATRQNDPGLSHR